MLTYIIYPKQVHKKKGKDKTTAGVIQTANVAQKVHQYVKRRAHFNFISDSLQSVILSERQRWNIYAHVLHRL